MLRSHGMTIALVLVNIFNLIFLLKFLICSLVEKDAAAQCEERQIETVDNSNH